jgi:trans-aconitate methyltransferase
MTVHDKWNPALYDAKHSFVYGYGADLVALMEPQPGERILDLGCGTGHLTAQIAAQGATVIGMDNSAAMIEQARERYPTQTFIQGDATNFAFEEPFDAVFSNAVLHWILAPEKVLFCVHRALKPVGRFVAELGGKGNVETFIHALYGALDAFGYPVPSRRPWYFPSPDEYTALLQKHGFHVTMMRHFERPTTLEGEDGVANFIRTFTPQYLEQVAPDERPAFIRDVTERLRPQLYKDGAWVMDYVRLRLRAERV